VSLKKSNKHLYFCFFNQNQNFIKKIQFIIFKCQRNKNSEKTGTRPVFSLVDHKKKLVLILNNLEINFYIIKKIKSYLLKCIQL